MISIYFKFHKLINAILTLMLILILILVIKEIYFDGHTPEPSYLDSSTDSFSVGPVQETPPSCDLLDVVIRKMTCS